MSDDDFVYLRDAIHSYCGIFLSDDMRFMVESRLKQRLEVHQISDFTGYLRFLRYGTEQTKELAEIIDLIVTNETFFFREDKQLKCFMEEVFPTLLESRKTTSPLRIWSAGCSSGEETFTIAMLLDEGKYLSKVACNIFGSDISRKVLKKARHGTYNSASMRSVTPQRLERYFKVEGNNYVVRDEIKKLVSFGYMNLMRNEEFSMMSNIDIVFCKNVMIYFSKESRKRLIDNFYKRMRPGGFLFIGHSESLMSTDSPFETVVLKNDIVYRKAI